MADSLIQLTIGLHEAPATVSDRVLRASESASAREALTVLANAVVAPGAGSRDAKVIARVDSVTRASATQTIAWTQANCTAGDKIYIDIPGWQRFTLTAVSGTPDPSAGEFAIITSDNAVGISFAAAINGMTVLKQLVSGVNSSGTVTLTALAVGTWAQGIKLTKNVTNSGAATLGGATFVGGADVLAQPTIVVTFGSADLVANDTTSIGSRKYTWKASASVDGEITLSTNEVTAATNFAAAVNTDANMIGVVSASRNSAVVTLTWLGDPRAGKHILCTYNVTNSGSVTLSGSAINGNAYPFVLTTTVTSSSTARTYGGKGAA